MELGMKATDRDGLFPHGFSSGSKTTRGVLFFLIQTSIPLSTLFLPSLLLMLSNMKGVGLVGALPS